jgi:hypothetical protein
MGGRGSLKNRSILNERRELAGSLGSAFFVYFDQSSPTLRSSSHDRGVRVLIKKGSQYSIVKERWTGWDRDS